MKKLTSLFAVVALSGAAVAGPVHKQQLNHNEVAKLAHAQQQSQHVLQVQAGNWADDYGAVTIACVFGAAALAVGIVALANN